MENNYVVGNVVSIEGMRINILMNEHSNLESFHHDGVFYDGVSIGSYIGIIRGSHKIIGRIEKEFLEDVDKEPYNHQFLRERFRRHIEVSLIGDMYKGKFEYGIKRFPMIFNEVVLLSDNEIKSILQRNSSAIKYKLLLGKSVTNDIPMELSGENLFNTHIGIFGNTGSGKSNTLTKLYTELFSLENKKICKNFNNTSKFFVIDFNGEYVRDGVLHKEKKTLELSTRKNSPDNSNKLPLEKSVFWDIETLSILYSATEKTQKPFLAGAVKRYIKDGQLEITSDRIIERIGESFYNIFKQNNNKEMLNLLHKSLEVIESKVKRECERNYEKISDSQIWLQAKWHSKNNTFYLDDLYMSNIKDEDIREHEEKLKAKLLEPKVKNNIDHLTVTEKLKIIVNLHLIYCLAYGRVNFEHINPLIQRIIARSSFIEKTIYVCDEEKPWSLVNVISLRNCNLEAKKMLPLLIAKQLYNRHKEESSDDNNIISTIHLIIDEAHNVLSLQSTREEEFWKDYRLEVFEEIIKEGRKFGFYITLASQRPYDISPTIISQVHNYFIHRLVNDQDLKMIGNTINSLDSVSKQQIPNLAPGQCIITGTSFDMPLLVQVDKLSKEKSPSSDNANLIKLWSNV